MGKRSKKTQDQLEGPRSIYEPLLPGYIRILILQPGCGETEIECELTIQSYNKSADKYAAISYVWGDPDNTITIKCNGFTKQITINLADALRQFRHPKTIRRLWADAICINQKDNKEKDHQVARMGEVYRNASCVLVWLGMETNCIAEPLFRSMEHTNEYLSSQFAKNNRNITTMPKLQEPFPIQIDHDTCSNLETLMDQPWFSRVWTIQECALAKECRVFWGAASINFADVAEASFWWAYHRDLDVLRRRYGFDNMVKVCYIYTSIYCSYGKEHSWQYSRPALRTAEGYYAISDFSRILWASSSLNANDPRDHVYAFLGCPYARDGNGKLLLEPNYSSPVETVYHQLACALVERPYGGPYMLSCIASVSRADILRRERPSWVPYWDEYKDFDIIADVSHTFKAGGPAAGYSARHGEGPLLHISGFIFDTIAWKSAKLDCNDFDLQPHMWSSEAQSAREPLIETLWRATSSAAAAQGTLLDFESFYLTLLCCWEDSTAPQPGESLESATAYKRVMQSLVDGYSGSSTEAFENGIFSHVHETAYQLVISTRGRSVILTASGGVGLAHHTAEVGDACCIILGAQSPFILAPVEGGRYRVVGDSYIHGVMDGELVDQLEPCEIVLE